MSSDIDRIARERLAADEAITGSRKNKVTLRQTAAEFWRHPSPWMIVTLLVAAVAWRLIEGDWRWSDLIGPAVLVAAVAPAFAQGPYQPQSPAAFGRRVGYLGFRVSR